MKNIKTIWIFFIVVVFSYTSCEKDDTINFKGVIEYNSENSNINEWCSSLFFLSETIGYTTTQEGKIYKTSDGGQNWTLLNSGTTVPLNTVVFLNETVGYVFGGESSCSPYPCEVFGSLALKTVDGGKTWIKQYVPYAWSELNSTYFFNEKTGFTVGLGLCIKTTDGGKTWHSFNIGKNNISKISFVNQQVGFSLDLTGGLFKTEDGGQTWKDISVSEEKITGDFCFFSEKTGYANDLNHLLKTTDGGNSWNLVESFENPINYIYFVNESIGLVISKKYLGESGIWNPWKHIVKFTNDGGETWVTKEYEIEELNERCLFSKDNIVYSLGHDKIFKLIIE